MTETKKLGLAFLKQEGTTVNMDTGHVLTPEEIAALPPRDDRRSHIYLSSGRKIYAHALIIGIDPKLSVSYGYDGTIPWPVQDWDDWTPPEGKLTADDMRELADMMIERWQKFKGTL